MKRAFLYFSIICSTIFTSCQSKKEDEQNTVKINIGSEPQSLDPRKVHDINFISLTGDLFEGLFRVAPSGIPVLGLADRIDSLEGGKKFLIHLRKSFWSDGTPLCSNDFVYSWSSSIQPSFPAPMASFLYVIKNAKKIKEGLLPLKDLGIQVIDSSTFSVELENPTPHFSELLSLPIFFPVPKHIVEKNPAWAEKRETYITCGPFSLADWKHQDKIILEKNEKYWDSTSVHLKKVVCFMIDSSTEYTMFESGELDWAGSPLSILPVEAIQKAKEEKKLHVEPFLGTAFIRVNLQSKKYPLSIRKVLCSSIDREGLVTHVLQGNQAPAYGLVPPNLLPSKELTSLYRSPEGWEKSLEVIDSPLCLTYPNQPRHHIIAQNLQEQWTKNLHIPIQLEAVETKVFYDRVAKGQYEMAIGSWVADYNDPLNFLEVFKYRDNGMNNTSWENSGYTDLLNAASLCKDDGARASILQKAQGILMEDKPIIPLYHHSMNYLKKTRVRDVYVSSLGKMDFKWAYIQEEKP